eukprot:UC1_evm1s1911
MGERRKSTFFVDDAAAIAAASAAAAAAAGKALSSSGGARKRKSTLKSTPEDDLLAKYTGNSSSSNSGSGGGGGSGGGARLSVPTTTNRVHRRRSVMQHVFHTSTSNQLAVKVFGSARAVETEMMRQNEIESAGSGWIIHPYSTFRWYWDMIVVILMAFTCITVPMLIAFYTENCVGSSWFVIWCVVDFFFLLDIGFNFRTGIATGDGDVIILDKLVIARRYLRGWFFIDLVSSFPFDLFVLTLTEGECSGDSQYLKASRAIRFLRITKLLSLLRLLRVTRIISWTQRWQDAFNFNSAWLRMVRLIVTMVLMAHWNGCMQFLAAKLSEFPAKCWVVRHGLLDVDPFTQYGWALFKALSHMLCIGYGRDPPQIVSEAWLTMFSMLTGATFYALFIGQISSTSK